MSAHRSRVLPLALLLACSEPAAPSQPPPLDIPQAIAAMQAAGLAQNPAFEALRLYAMAQARELP